MISLGQRFCHPQVLEDVQEAIEQVKPKVHGKTPTLALLYRLCIEAGLLTR